jgi:hypothetical protein
MRDMQEAHQQLREALGKCLIHGYKPPLYVTAISSNGAMLYLRYDPTKTNDDFEGVKLAEYHSDDTFKSPGNVVIADSKGRATRLVLTSEEIEPQD